MLRPISMTLARGALALMLMAGAAAAQTPPAAPAAGGEGPGAAAKPQAPKPAGGGDAGLRQRVEQLEEQLVDLQVIVGTLESLARTGGGASQPAFQPAPAVGASDGRVESLQAQIRVLQGQVDALAAEVRQRQGTDAVPRPAAPAAPGAWSPADANRAPAASVSQFGGAAATASEGDPIGGLIGDTPVPVAGETLPDLNAPGQVAAVNPGAAGGDPKQLYEQAYGYLLQQDYGAAQAGFNDFLKRHPRDALAPNALYWLGETHYVQKNYGDAAEAFDLVTVAYAQSAKAPDALLKRGMSLAQLGKKDQGCSALKQVSAKYPNAPQNIKARADSERQRLACP